MAEDKKTPAKKTAAKKAPAKKAETKATKAPKAASGKTVTVKQTGSPVGRNRVQRATLIGLGLNKMGRTKTLEDTPSIRGMITKVRHLVKVQDAA